MTAAAPDASSDPAGGVVAVSVVISTRNRARYLPEVLGTLAAQQCEFPFEVIVVDNGSTDDTPAVLAEWCGKDARFRTTREPRPGLSRGKNAGIRMARAPLLLFTDDDMRVEPQWISAYERLFRRLPREFAVCGGPIVPIPQDLGAWPDWLGVPALADAGMLHYGAERALGIREYVWGGNMAASRLLFDRFGLWDETAGLQGDQRVRGEDSKFFEDTELQDRVRGSGGTVWFCADAVVHHRVDRQSITPRRISATAFAKGRNAVWAQPRDRRGTLAGLLAVAGSLVRWGGGVILLRAWRRKDSFERVRLAAFAAGFALDSLRAARESKRLFRSAASLVFPVRGLILRLTPDVP